MLTYICAGLISVTYCRDIYKTRSYYKYSYILLMTNLIKLACFTVIFGLIAHTGLNIFNTLNTYQLERIEAINTVLQDI